MHCSACSGVKYLSFGTLALILCLALDYRYTTAKGKVSVACSSFVSMLKNQFSLWAKRSMMIATFILCSKRAFTDVLGVFSFENFLGQALNPINLPLLCQSSPIVIDILIGGRDIATARYGKCSTPKY